MGKDLVILDTCVIRNVLHEKKQYFLFWRKNGYVKIIKELIKQKAKADFRIGETAFAELVKQLLNRSIKFKEWKKRIKLFDKLIDVELPIQYFGRDLSVEMNIKTGLNYSDGFSKDFWVKAWELIRSAKTKKDLEKEITYKDINGKPFKRTINEDLVKKVFEDEYFNWICNFRLLKKLIIEYNGDSKNKIKLESQNDFKTLIEGDMKEYNSNKIQDFACVQSKYVELYINGQYRPESKKRDNDVFDFSFLHILSKPALFCTTDKKFQGFAKESKAPNANNIMTPQEILYYLKSKQ